MSVLDEIVEYKRTEVEAARTQRPRAEIEALLPSAPPTRSLAQSLRSPPGRWAVISEVKKASPSKGLIREDFDPVAIARGYAAAGAAGVSVLTDEKYFQGKLEFLQQIRAQVPCPCLRKDFIIDSYQVVEARVAGADAILLILAATTDGGLLAALAQEAESLGMEVLWEVHNRAELERLLPMNPTIVGINNRNLHTFEVSLETTRSLLPLVPESTVTVSESGFFKSMELKQMSEWGVNAFLIGESLMRASDPGAALTQLLAGEDG